MEVDIARFNDPKYFQKLVETYPLKWNNYLMDDYLCEELKGPIKAWIYSDPIIQTEDNLDEVELNIIGIKFNVGVCDDSGGYYIYFEDELNLHGLDYDKYFVYDDGVWYASLKMEDDLSDFYDTDFPVIFDKETYGQNFYRPKFCSKKKFFELANNSSGLLKVVENLPTGELKKYLCGKWVTEIDVFYYAHYEDTNRYQLIETKRETAEVKIIDIHKLGSRSLNVIIEPFKTSNGLTIKICDWVGRWDLYQNSRSDIVQARIVNLIENPDLRTFYF